MHVERSATVNAIDELRKVSSDARGDQAVQGFVADRSTQRSTEGAPPTICQSSPLGGCLVPGADSPSRCGVGSEKICSKYQSRLALARLRLGHTDDSEHSLVRSASFMVMSRT